MRKLFKDLTAEPSTLQPDPRKDELEQLSHEELVGMFIMFIISNLPIVKGSLGVNFRQYGEKKQRREEKKRERDRIIGVYLAIPKKGISINRGVHSLKLT